MSTYRRILRGADQTCRYWVALEEEKCIGEHFHTLRNFCEERGLSLSRHGHSVMSEHKFYQVFMVEEHAEIFSSAASGSTLPRRDEGRVGPNGTRVLTRNPIAKILLAFGLPAEDTLHRQPLRCLATGETRRAPTVPPGGTHSQSPFQTRPFLFRFALQRGGAVARRG